MLGAMAVGCDDARSAWRAICEAADAGGTARDGRAALVRAREAAVAGTTDGVQILGGYGYMEDYGQERRMRDARQLASLLGRPDVLKLETASAWIADGGR